MKSSNQIAFRCWTLIDKGEALTREETIRIVKECMGEDSFAFKWLQNGESLATIADALESLGHVLNYYGCPNE